MLRYAISDRRLFRGTDVDRRKAVVAQAARLASSAVDYFQIREKDLHPADLLDLTMAVRHAVEANGPQTRVVLNGPLELAARAGVAVHQPFRTWSGIRESSGLPARVASISCHSPEEIEAASAFADVLLFAPVFEKQAAGERIQAGSGLAALTEACSRSAGTPVIALGGVTQANAPDCMAAGAAGVAGIRMFLAG